MTTCSRCQVKSKTKHPWAHEGWAVTTDFLILCPICYEKLKTLRQQVREFEAAKMREFMEYE